MGSFSRFRREHSGALVQVLRQCAQVCLQLGLVEGNTLFVDGTKMRANASNKHTWTAKRCSEELARIDERSTTILRECEQTDIAEESATTGSLPERLQSERTLRARIEEVLEELKRDDRTGLNTTDPEAGRMRIGAQVETGYNCQAADRAALGLPGLLSF